MLRAELAVLRNAFTTAEGRTELAGSVIVLACCAVGGFLLGEGLTRPEAIAVLREQPGVLAALCAVLAVLPVLAFASAPCRQQLFVAAWLPVVLASPVRPVTALAAVWLRQSFGLALLGLALAGVPAFVVTARAGLPVAFALGICVVIAASVAVAVAVVVLVQVALERWLRGSRLRQLLTALHVVFAASVVVLLVAGFARGADLAGSLRTWHPDGKVVGIIVGSVTALPVGLANGAVDARGVSSLVALLGSAGLCLAIAAAPYRRAYEAWLCRVPAAPLLRRGAAWPERALPSLLHKARLEAWRMRGNVVVIAVLAVIAVWQAATVVVTAPPDDPAPRLRFAFALLTPWQMLVTVMATLLLLGVVGDEQRQLPLLASSPLPRHAFLWSRVVIVGWPFAMTLLLAAIAGGLAGGIDWLAVLGFAAAAVPVALVLLGSTLALGTWPAFVRVHEATPLAGNLRSVVPILLLALVAGLALWLHYMAREHLLGPASELAPFVLAGAWLAGGVAFAVGCRLAQHNLERLLGPR